MFSFFGRLREMTEEQISRRREELFEYSESRSLRTTRYLRVFRYEAESFYCSQSDP